MNGRARSSWQSRAASTCGVVAITSFAILHLVMAPQVDPLRQPVSSYALTGPGVVIFPLGALALAAACAILAVTGAGVARQHFIRWPLAIAAVMLVLVVVFRTDSTESVSSMAGEIHRWSAGAAFGLLTAAALATAWQSKTAGLGRWPTRLTIASLGLLLIIVANTFMPTLADGDAWRGLPQRLLLAVQSSFVIVLALAARTGRVPRAVGSPVRDRAPIINTAPHANWTLWT
ncbi:MAG: DUF998 domain-containing protein, partial [Stackebrandtia sp.]